MTRSELKGRYVRLARLSHPDAVRQQQQESDDDNDDEDDPAVYDFTEIAAAWEILGDRKQRRRYDRSLQAAAFARRVEDWAGENIQPFVRQVAIPLFQRTTTVAAGTVAAAAQAAKAVSQQPQTPPHWQRRRQQQQQRQSQTSPTTSVSNAQDNDENDDEDEDVILLTPDEQNQQYRKQTTTAKRRSATESKGFAPTTTATTTAFNDTTQASDLDVQDNQESNVNAREHNTEQESQTTTAAASSSSSYSSYSIHDTSPSLVRSGNRRSSRRGRGDGVDPTLLWEKAEALERRAEWERRRAHDAARRSQALVRRRLALALHTPRSGLTAREATVLLEELQHQHGDDDDGDEDERPSPLDRAMMMRRGHTVWDDIRTLRAHEGDFLTAQYADEGAQDVYRDTVQRRVAHVEALSRAIEREDAARRAWVRAQEDVQAARQDLVDTTRALAQVEIQARKSDYELQCTTVDLERQSERVRKALRQKRDQAAARRRQPPPQQQDDYEGPAWEEGPPPATYYDDDFDDDCDAPERHEALQEMRSEERMLQDTSRYMEDLATRLQSRAHKLRVRAQTMEEGGQQRN